MNPVTALALILELYAQITAEREQRAALEARIAELEANEQELHRLLEEATAAKIESGSATEPQ